MTMKRTVVLAVAGIFVLSACATNPDGTYRLDEKATGALIGAAAGCAVGAAAKGAKGCVVGAVVGAAAGFLVSWYFESKKIADAATVNAEYERGLKASAKGKRKGKGSKTETAALPRDGIVPTKFESHVDTGRADSSGQKEVQITSNTDLVGYGDKVPEVQQKYAIYDEKNQLIEEKTEKLAAVDGAGRYQTNSKFKLPSDAKSKNYTVKTTLISNDKTYRENTYKISLLGDHAFMLAALDR